MKYEKKIDITISDIRVNIFRKKYVEASVESNRLLNELKENGRIGEYRDEIVGLLDQIKPNSNEDTGRIGLNFLGRSYSIVGKNQNAVECFLKGEDYEEANSKASFIGPNFHHKTKINIFKNYDLGKDITGSLETYLDIAKELGFETYGKAKIRTAIPKREFETITHPTNLILFETVKNRIGREDATGIVKKIRQQYEDHNPYFHSGIKDFERILNERELK
jgi:hypothetical protein